MMLRFGACALISALVLAAACSSDVTSEDDGTSSGCEPVTCDMACDHGFQTGADGCGICACNPPPGGCDPVPPCDMFCENGFAAGPDGCPICQCASTCEGPNPAGCIVNGCPEDSVCDTSRGCASSSCACDEASGTWTCTNDCGGGVCVPGASACRGPDPSGCKSKGCPAGQTCNGELGCFPSGCACDPRTGGWGCTADCGGGVCVPDPTGCSEPDPTGCMQTGCPPDQACQLTSGVCVPSWCTCDARTGTWSCTDDCGGGKCAPP